MLLSEKRLFLLDMDGTLYLDDRLFDRVPDFLSHIRRIGGRWPAWASPPGRRTT